MEIWRLHFGDKLSIEQHVQTRLSWERPFASMDETYLTRDTEPSFTLDYSRNYAHPCILQVTIWADPTVYWTGGSVLEWPSLFRWDLYH